MLRPSEELRKDNRPKATKTTQPLNKLPPYETEKAQTRLVFNVATLAVTGAGKGRPICRQAGGYGGGTWRYQAPEESERECEWQKREREA
jgi:hypothetical protein